VGALYADPSSKLNAGKSYVVFGPSCESVSVFFSLMASTTFATSSAVKVPEVLLIIKVLEERV
jgi:hypothetical protein